MNIDTNGAVLSYRYIVNDRSEPITAGDVDSIVLTVYKKTMSETALFGREALTNWNGIQLNIDEVITAAGTTPNGANFNFRYCVEGAFTDPKTSYIIEYILTMYDGHTKPIVIPVNTGA